MAAAARALLKPKAKKEAKGNKESGLGFLFRVCTRQEVGVCCRIRVETLNTEWNALHYLELLEHRDEEA